MSIVGIDLGTTFSLIARLRDDGEPQVIANAEGSPSTPSAIYFDTASEVVVGEHAISALRDAPEQVIQHPKRYLGNDDYHFDIHDKQVSPLAASSLILRKLKQDAEEKIGPISKAVITVPAYFDEGRRQATVAAGELAGLDVVDIINEPTAAALASAFMSSCRSAEDINTAMKALTSDDRIIHRVIYDLGGGTFDVTVLKQHGARLTVLATAGDVHLGGIDWTKRIADHLAEMYLATHETDPRKDPVSNARLLAVAEQMKRELSNRRNISWEFSFKGNHIEGKMDRDEYESMTSDLLYRTENRLSRVLRDAGLGWDAISEVIAVGGSSRMPQVLNMLHRLSGKKPNTSLSPDQIVAQGAAIHAAMVAAGATDTSRSNTTTEFKPSHEDEADGNGLISRWSKSLLSLLKSLKATNVNSHSLGIIASDRSGGKVVSKMIPKNTALPSAMTKSFGTIVENQKRITVEIVEGESEDPSHCISVGVCSVRDLPKQLPKRSPVEVRFEYDNSGRLHVEVVHIASGTWGQVVIQRSGGVDPERIEINRELLGRMTVN